MANEFSLYEITNAFPTLMDNYEISDEEKEKLYKELTVLLQKKSESTIGYIRNIDLTIEAMKNEEKRISELRKSLEEKEKRFKDYVKECMEKNGLSKVETSLGTLSIAKNPISVEIVNESKIPDEFKEIIMTTKTNKKAITDNFKATGEIPDGVNILTQNTSLRIK